MPEDTATSSPKEMGPPMEMAPPPNTRLLKVVVVTMGLLLVLGFAVVVATIVRRASHPEAASSAVGFGGRFGVSDVHVEPGQKVRSVTMTDERLAIHVGSDKAGGNGGEEIIIVSAKTGVELGRIRLRPLTDLAQSGALQ
ncbi:MAG TPA: hypothetical protein VF449_01695 [Parvibaculum sp.]